MTSSTTNENVQSADEALRSERTWGRGRFTAGALGLLVAAVYLWESQRMAFGSLDAPGPGLFPVVIGIAFGTTSLAVMVEALRNTDTKQLELPVGKERRTLVSVVAAFVAFAVLLPAFGFVLSAPVLLAVYMRIVGRKPWWKCALFGAVTTATVYIVFAVLIDVRLPQPVWS